MIFVIVVTIVSVVFLVPGLYPLTLATINLVQCVLGPVRSWVGSRVGVKIGPLPALGKLGPRGLPTPDIYSWTGNPLASVLSGLPLIQHGIKGVALWY